MQYGGLFIFREVQLLWCKMKQVKGCIHPKVERERANGGKIVKECLIDNGSKLGQGVRA